MKNALVLMTTYNGSKYVEEQIDSILSQEDVDVTLFILDDYSTDGTFEMLSKRSFENKKISVFRNNHNIGVPAINFFALMEKVSFPAQYDYFAFADQDDFWLPQKLNRAILCMIEHGAELYASGLKLWDGEKVYGFQSKSNSQKKFDHLFQSASAGCTYVMSINLFYLIRDTVRGVDFSDWKYFSHDWFVYFITRHNQLNVFIDSASFINYRIHSNNNFGLVDFSKPTTILKRISFLNSHWYRNHLMKMLPFLTSNSIEYNLVNTILSKNIFHRAMLLLVNGRQLRRELSYNIVLNFLILTKRI